MKKIIVKHLMVPIEEYATVFEDETLSDAIRALERAQQAFDHTKYRHRAIIVFDRTNRPVGKISQIDALKALEPKYREIQCQDTKGTFRHFSRMFLNSMLEHHRLFHGSLNDLKAKANKIQVKEFMHTLQTDECVNEHTTLDEATHIQIMSQQQSLLVTRGDEVVGILRLTDVFAAVFQSLSVSHDSVSVDHNR